LDENAKHQPWIIKMKPKLDEVVLNRMKFKFSFKMWMNVEAFSFIVIFYVASLASAQKNFNQKKKKTVVRLSKPEVHDTVNRI
jgi:hypothetical protein